MIKLLVFDLDQVLINSADIHRQALNKALAKIGKEYCFTLEEDLRVLGARTSRDKLIALSTLKGLPAQYHEQVLADKKEYALEILKHLPCEKYFSFEMGQLVRQLKEDGYLIYLASNTNMEFIQVVLRITQMVFDAILCNSNISHPKPHPEIYLQAVLRAGVAPDETLVFEDSVAGQEAALRAGAHLYPVERPSDLNHSIITTHIASLPSKTIKWHSKKTNVVIPMAGEGSRFKNAGWQTPKPFIEVNGLPMVQAVIDDLNIDAHFIFLIKKEHEEEYKVSKLLKIMAPGCTIVTVSGKQQGAASTILHAKSYINNDHHLLIVNADQMWDWNAKEFYYSVTQSQIDGSIVVIEDKSRNPKWSFVRTDDTDQVVEVAEKNPISDLASVGIYYFARGSDFVHHAEQMMARNIRTNNEYYVAPVYNLFVEAGMKVNTYHISRFWPTGTPEELTYYLNHRGKDV